MPWVCRVHILIVFADCVDEDKNQIVGLIVEDNKFRRGDKGRITATHCNPRVLSLFRTSFIIPSKRT